MLWGKNMGCYCVNLFEIAGNDKALILKVIENYGGLANNSTMDKSYRSRAVVFSTGN